MLFIFLPLPKIAHHIFQISTKSLRELKTAHGIGWDCLCDLLDENFAPTNWKEFTFPTSKLFATRSLILVNTWVFNFPIMEGSPKYLLSLESCIGPSNLNMHSFVSWGVFGLKNTEDLSALIFYQKPPHRFGVCWQVFDILARLLCKIEGCHRQRRDGWLQGSPCILRLLRFANFGLLRE